MGNEIQKSLAQRAKELLQTDEEHSLFELAELLRQYRNETHPDKFQDQELKTAAETRFKDAQSLLEELEKQLELDRFNRKPSELAVYKPLYDVVQLQSELDKTKKDFEDAKYELKNERENSDALSAQLEAKRDDSLSAEIQHLQEIYKPSTRNYASIGLAIILSGALAVMTQMEKVSGILEKHSPFEKQYIGTGLFLCLVLFLAALFRKIWEREYIKRKSEEVCSPKCANDFTDYLNKRPPSPHGAATFSEVDAFDFLAGDHLRLKAFLSYLGFRIFGRDTTNRVKDIFIHNLLNKKLVEFSKAESLQRHFKITNAKDESDFWREAWQAERAKNEARSDLPA